VILLASIQLIAVCLVCCSHILLLWSTLCVPQGFAHVRQGSILVPQVSILVPRGSILVPQVSVLVPRGSILVPQVSVLVPQGSAVAPLFFLIYVRALEIIEQRSQYLILFQC